MNLLFLSQANLADSFFMKSLVGTYRPKGPTLLVHDHFGKAAADTRFVTKRISSLLSDNLVVNNAFSGDQRGILAREGGRLTVNGDFLRHALQVVPLVILNPLVREGDGHTPANADEVLLLLRNELVQGEVVLFTRNMKSPLAAQRTLVQDEGHHAQLAALYEEEAESLRRALALRPAVLASPANVHP